LAHPGLVRSDADCRCLIGCFPSVVLWDPRSGQRQCMA